jgi:hypothetical protein
MVQDVVRRWSVEYVDAEGDVVVKHVDATAADMGAILEGMWDQGLNPSANDLSPPGPEQPAVLCFDDPVQPR